MQRLKNTIMNRSPFITEKEAIKEDFKGRTNFWLCRPEITNARDLQICRAVLPAGECHDFHHHPELEEAIYVLEGEVEQWVGTEKRVLRAGDLAHMAPGVVHATFNTSQNDAVILAILSPGSQHGPFLIDVSADPPWASIRETTSPQDSPDF
jgi:quercetin dioxygenase-like cupin family protein